MVTIDAGRGHDLSDAQWAVLEPLVPARSPRGRPWGYPRRMLIDGVRFRTRVGCPWRDVPDRYGPWWRVYTLFACWRVLGVWARIEAALRERPEADGRIDWQVSVDSTTARAQSTPRARAAIASIALRENRITTPWESPGAGSPPRPTPRSTSTVACWPSC